jgi:carboxymethylenebutenolidase
MLPAKRFDRLSKICTASVFPAARGNAMHRDELVALWEAHCRYEFETHDVDATMTTMVAEPYLNNIPTLAGGVGRDQVRRFYKDDFIGANPPDTKVTPISRTVGDDCIVDEVIFSFTHTTTLPWMLPGIAPSGRKVEVPIVAVVKFRDGKIAHEHIYWDQASVLVQIGLLDPETLPVAGIETALRLADPTRPANPLRGKVWPTGRRP